MKISSAALLAVIGTSLQGEVISFSTFSPRNSRSSSSLLTVPKQTRTFHGRKHHVKTPYFVLNLASRNNNNNNVLPTINLQTAPPEQIEDLVRSEYETWCQDFGKTANESRYPIFKRNYLMQLQYNQQTGVYCGLNEYGDMTPEEFEQLTAQPAHAPVPATAVTPDQVDAKIRSEYQNWGTEYGKDLSEERYTIFKQNFLDNMKYYEQTGNYYVLNEYADMTPEEFGSMTAVPQQPNEMVDEGPTTSPPMSGNYMDSLGGGSAPPKGSSSYMPKSYKPSSGSGMPSYFDNMNAAPSSSSSSSFSGPATSTSDSSYSNSMSSFSTSASAGPPSGAGLPSYADGLSGGTGKMKESSYMPKSYKQSSGSVMPSYFDNMGSASSGANTESYSTPAPSEPSLTPAGPGGTGNHPASVSASSIKAPSSGAGMSSYADALSGGPGKMKSSSYMPKSYKQSSGSGMPSYFDQLGSGSSNSDTASSYSAGSSYSEPSPTYSSSDMTAAAGSPPTGAGMPSYADRLSGGTGKMKESSFMPKSYKPTSGSGMPSYFNNMGSDSNSDNNYSAPPPAYSSPEPTAAAGTPPTGAGMPSYADRLSGGPGKMKESSFMPKSFNKSSGSGMPSYFDNLGSGGGGATSSTGYSTSPTPSVPEIGASAGSPPTGAGMPSYADNLSGGSGKMKDSSYMPKSYKQSSGTGMPSYFDNMGAGAGGGGAQASYSTPPVSAAPEPAVATGTPPTGAGLPSYADGLSGGPGKMKESSYMPKSYETSPGSGMPSYFDNLRNAPASNSNSNSYEGPPAPPVAPSSGAGLPSYADQLSGGPGKVAASSYMPKSYKKSSGSGMPSYFDNIGGGTTTSSPSALSSSPLGGGIPSYLDNDMNGVSGVASTAPSGAGMPSYADSLSGGSGKMKDSSYMPKSFKESSSGGSGMPSYLDNMGSAWGTTPETGGATASGQKAQVGYKDKSPSPDIRPNLASDQSAQLARVATPAQGPRAGHASLANPVMKKSHALKCDQTLIMREGEPFLPHAMDPVIKHGNLEPDQSGSMRYFFTGRLCASEPFQPIPMQSRFPSDQERADNETRRTLMHYQKANRRVRRYNE